MKVTDFELTFCRVKRQRQLSQAALPYNINNQENCITVIKDLVLNFTFVLTLNLMGNS